MDNKKSVSLISSVLLLFGILNLSYGYFSFLRLFITCSSLYIFLVNKEKDNNKSNIWGVLFLIVAILFNPIFPIYLDKEIWRIIDFLVAGLYIILYFSDSNTFEKKIQRLFDYYKNNTKYVSLGILNNKDQLEDAIIIIANILEQDINNLNYHELRLYGDIYTILLGRVQSAIMLDSSGILERTSLLLLKRFPIIKTKDKSDKLIKELLS